MSRSTSPRVPGGETTVHDSRTLMLDDLVRLLDHLPAGSATPDVLHHLVLEDNVLGKRTVRTRAASLRYLGRLYPLGEPLMDAELFRTLWHSAPEGRGVLALLLALGRDHLLRQSVPFILALPVGGAVTWPDLAAFLKGQGVKYNEKTLKSSAQNLLSTWTQAGWLAGKVKKRRRLPSVSAEAVTLALWLGFLEGARGLALLNTSFTRVLEASPATLDQLAFEASRRGWLTYRRIADVLEITFPPLKGGEGA